VLLPAATARCGCPLLLPAVAARYCHDYLPVTLQLTSCLKCDLKMEIKLYPLRLIQKGLLGQQRWLLWRSRWKHTHLL